MGLLDALTDPVKMVDAVESSTREQLALTVLELNAALNENEVLAEGLADVELAREDVGWIRLNAWGRQQFSRNGLTISAELCRVMAASDPLIKRGLGLRAAYVFGDGVEIQAKDSKFEDLAGVVSNHVDINVNTVFGSQAQVELERALGTDGNVFLAHFTKPTTGRVKVRSIPFTEITERVCNPEDKDEPWFYKREWTATIIGNDGQRSEQQRKAYYPDINYRPRSRPKKIDNGVDVIWDAPVLHVCVNRLDGWDFGLGDAFAAIDWARGYSTFLNDWARLMKALSKYAWRVTGERASSAKTAATAIRKNVATTGADSPVRSPNASDAGATAVMAGANLEAIPKSGATIDAESGRPLAAMVAAALGVPVTMLLADPGQTGARAVAETLDRPTKKEFELRQRLWQRAYLDSIDYAIDQAVKAPAGGLTGTIGRDEWDTETIELANGDRTVDVTFGDLDDIDVKTLIDAIVAADGTDKVPPLVIARLLLIALGVEDVDTALEEMTDSEGNWIDPGVTAGDDAARRFRNGEDPAEAL